MLQFVVQKWVRPKKRRLCDFSENAEPIESISEATMRIMNSLSDMPEGPDVTEEVEDEDADIIPAKAKAHVSAPTVWEYTHKDVILYGLGVGAGPAKEPCELKYIYENHEDFMVSIMTPFFSRLQKVLYQKVLYP